ncbi:MAG: hypothetical protein AAGA48_05055 [Myxococcota bacterium]
MIGWIVASLALAGPQGDEVSRSRGSSRGVVVLWPRVVPETDDPSIRDLADRMQDRLYAAAAKVVPYRRVDVRPAPERVCPREDGCRAPAVSVMIGHREGGCVMLGLLHPPGTQAPIAFTIAGKVEQIEALGFRDPPERSVVVREFTSCAYVEATYQESAFVEGLRALIEGRSVTEIEGIEPISPRAVR